MFQISSPTMSGPPMLRGSSLCAWLYTLVLSLLNGVVGGGLIALCYKSFSTPTHEIGIVLRMCLVAGTGMVVFVFFWIIFIFCTWRASGQITQSARVGKNRHQLADQVADLHPCLAC